MKANKIKISNFLNEDNKYCFGCIFCILILITRLWNISVLDGPILIHDEAGYWGHAANINGLEWTETINLWYSYGYSFLLVPLFWITHDMSLMYRLAILLNAIMGIASFILGISIIKELDEKCSDNKAMFISFISTCYSAYLFQANLAWAESLIYTWFLLIIWTAIRCFRKVSTGKMLLFSIEIIILYIIHNRNLVILIAFFLTITYMIFRKRIKFALILGIFAIFMIAGVLDNAFKSELSLLMWGKMGAYIGNDISAYSNKLTLFFSIDGLKTLFGSMVGKVWYELSATLLFAYFGVLYLGKKITFSLRSSLKNCLNDIHYFYVFIGLCVCGVIALAALTMIPKVDYSESVRLDLFFYGRYSDMISGILIIFGLIYLTNLKTKKNFLAQCIIGLIVYLVFSGMLFFQINPIEDYYVNTFCAPGVFFSKSFSFTDVFFKVIITFILSVAIYIIANEKFGLSGKRIVSSSLGTVFVLIFCLVAQNAYLIDIYSNQMTRTEYREIANILSSAPEYPTYFLVENDVMKQYLRSQVVDGRFIYQKPEEFEKNCFLVIAKHIDVTPLENIYYITSVGDFFLMGVGDELIRKIEISGYESWLLPEWKVLSLDMLDANIKFSPSQEIFSLGRKEDLSVDIVISSPYDYPIINDKSYKISYRIYDEAGNIILWEGEKYDINSFMNQISIPIVIRRKTFPAEGVYCVKFDIIGENLVWGSEEGFNTPKLMVTIQ